MGGSRTVKVKTSELTAKQREYLSKMQRGGTPTKKPNDRTMKSLSAKGLVKYAFFVGWHITAEGLSIELLEGLANGLD